METLRRDTPGCCAGLCHLNNAGKASMLADLLRTCSVIKKFWPTCHSAAVLGLQDPQSIGYRQQFPLPQVLPYSLSLLWKLRRTLLMLKPNLEGKQGSASHAVVNFSHVHLLLTSTNMQCLMVSLPSSGQLNFWIAGMKQSSGKMQPFKGHMRPSQS